jgi:parallel beta-helix repeat protein
MKRPKGERITAAWVLLAVIALFPLGGWVSHQGPVSVDASAPPEEDLDGDRHFRTLQAALMGPLAPYETISVDPGRYEGDLEITVEGLVLRSTGGAHQTTLAGRLIIRARGVRIEGFSIEGPPTGAAIVVAAEGVTLAGNRILGGDLGVLVERTHEITLEQNKIYNHARDGLVIRDVRALRLINNELRGNGGAGVWIERSQELVIEGNSLAFNRLGGMWLKESDGVQILANTIQDNDLAGIALDKSSESRIEGNELISNQVGILLIEAGANVILANEIGRHHVVGLVIKNHSQGNSIEENTIWGNRGPGAAGVRISGGASNNRLVGNRLLENGIGIVLSANETGGPTNNTFEGNEIARSDRMGVKIEAGAERNRFVANEIYLNLEEGIVSAGAANIYEDNEIYDNGAAGLLLWGSRDARLQGNRVYGNGAEGLRLEESSGTLLMDNELVENVREGLAILKAESLRLVQNTIASNGGSGLEAQGVESLSLMENSIRDNSGHGAYFERARDLVIEGNEIEANGSGGIRLEGVQGADLEANRLNGNLHFGLFVLESERISARRNFWGDREGPAGAFTGSGNAVLGLKLEQVTPWLPAEPDELVLNSVSAMVIDPLRGSYIVFDAAERLGLILELHQPGRGERGHTELVSKVIIIAARYASRPEGTPPLGAELGFYIITVAGIDSGAAELTLLYKEEDQPPGFDPERLKLFILERGEWVPLPGRADPGLRRVTGEILISQLDGRLIALGMLTRTSRPLNFLPGIWGGWVGPLWLLIPLLLYLYIHASLQALPSHHRWLRRPARSFRGTRP